MGIFLMARERNVALPVHQVLVYPVANFASDSPSFRENAFAKPLNAKMMSWFFSHYLKNDADARSPLISLVSAPNMAGLPPTTIINAQIDPLRSEGEMLAQRLKAAGVKVDEHTYEGVNDEFFGMGAVVGDAKGRGIAGGQEPEIGFRSVTTRAALNALHPGRAQRSGARAGGFASKSLSGAYNAEGQQWSFGDRPLAPVPPTQEDP